MQDYSPNTYMPYPQTYDDYYDDYDRIMSMSVERLERMYPQIYYIINPVVIRQCNMLEETYGQDFIPSREELDGIIDSILAETGGRIRSEYPERGEKGSNPPGNPDGNPNGSPFLRGLIGTLLIRELIGRRRGRRRFPRRFSPGFFPGFFPGFPGFFPGFF